MKKPRGSDTVTSCLPSLCTGALRLKRPAGGDGPDTRPCTTSFSVKKQPVRFGCKNREEMHRIIRSNTDENERSVTTASFSAHTCPNYQEMHHYLHKKRTTHALFMCDDMCTSSFLWQSVQNKHHLRANPQPTQHTFIVLEADPACLAFLDQKRTFINSCLSSDLNVVVPVRMSLKVFATWCLHLCGMKYSLRTANNNLDIPISSNFLEGIN